MSKSWLIINHFVELTKDDLKRHEYRNTENIIRIKRRWCISRAINSRDIVIHHSQSSNNPGHDNNPKYTWMCCVKSTYNGERFCRCCLSRDIVYNTVPPRQKSISLGKESNSITGWNLMRAHTSCLLMYSYCSYVLVVNALLVQSTHIIPLIRNCCDRKKYYPFLKLQ